MRSGRGTPGPATVAPFRRSPSAGRSRGANVGSMRRAALVAVMAALLCACAVPVAGLPTPAPGSATSPSGRPRTVLLEGVDSCALLTSAQVAQLSMEEPGLRRSIAEASSCSWFRFTSPSVSTLVSAYPSRGIGEYDTDPARNDVAMIAVRGFPAMQLSFKARHDNCAVVVDVAPGQVVDVQFSAFGTDVPISISDLCAGGRQVADDAIDTLLKQR